MPSSRNIRALPVRLFAELAIIFIGVSAAFLVENYRQELQEQRRARQHATALYSDLSNFGMALDGYVSRIRQGLAAMDSVRAAGGRPAPYVLRVPGAESPPIGVWDATLQAGAGEVMDPVLMGDLASFYNEVSGETAKYQRYALFTEQRIWPLLAAGDTAAFYDASGSLRPEFVAHRWQLEELLDDLAAQAGMSRTLAARLRDIYPSAARGADPDGE